MCDQVSSVSRRRFLMTSTACLATAGALPKFLHGAPDKSSKAETYIGEFFEGLTESQRREICYGLDNPAMVKAHANWHISKPLIGSDFYSKSQQALLEKIVQNVTSEDGYARLQKQMDDDDGGLGAYSVGMFGNPSEDRFQWVLTGRHLTLRADGNTMKASAFGGPLVYGHGEESSASANLFYYQTKEVNKVFDALNTDQRKQALLGKIPSESNVAPRKSSDSIPGLSVGQMSGDQKGLVKQVVSLLLAPYRSEDSAEAMQLIEEDGFDNLRFAFFREEDLEGDGIWDMWRIEGPRTVMHFRGAPHVHAFIHVG